MRKRLLIIYLILSFTFGIFYTKYDLQQDVKKAKLTSGRVNLLCSYWYEKWNPREVLTWWVINNRAPLYPGVVDKAAWIVYGQFMSVRYGESDYVLTAYPGGLKRVDPWHGFWGIYEVKR